MNDQQKYSLCERILNAYMSCDWDKARELERIYFTNPRDRANETKSKPSRPFMCETAYIESDSRDEGVIRGYN